MKIHVASETAYMIKGNGVHTAFVDHVELLKSQNDVTTVVNNEGRGDVFHCHTYGLYYFLKGLRYKHRRIHTVHVIPDSIKGSLPAWKLWMPFVKWYMKQVYSYADVCIAISPRVEEAIEESGANTRIVRIYNPIPVDRWKRTAENRKKGREMLGLSETEFVVLGVGQLQARKGVEDFMDVAAAVPEAKFVWAGGRPFGIMTEGITRIDSRINESDGGNLHFTGMLNLDMMPYVYAAADAMLFTSYQENCPLAPIEGAACGMPVIFRDIPEYRSLYENPYLKASTTSEFIEMTRRLIHDQAYYQQGSDISAQLISQFDKRVIREKLLKLYDWVCTADVATRQNKVPRLQPA
jgi:1,2-diacylglycerol-3-alpha-glucose alpha-1,2-galactosyltransferase